MTVLSIVRATMGRLNLTQPSVVFTSSDKQVVQMRELLLEEAEHLSKYGAPTGWQSLTREQTFITVAAFEQTNTPIPADFRRFVPNSFWNRDTERPVTGPLTPQQWQAQRARGSLSQLYLGFRERDGDFLLTAGGSTTPPAGETIAYEYVSSYYAIGSGGAAKAEFTSDDDTTYLDEELLKLGLRWRWKQAKGLDYGEDMATYERAVESSFGNDGGSTELNIGGPSYLWEYWRYNLPEGGFGL